ncbi:MAG TPA: 7-carboxy-7-deazaguanine synthase QueE, partial [Methanomethylovorans sp.]|nr:7-carboxy-7-deazaguanine synthase QueE [Methanomethylovorans sp.]
MEAPITEIFCSVQGEGPYVGNRQLFLRFAGCN